MKRPADTLHDTVLEDALLANGEAHIEGAEVAVWIAEGSGHDLLGEACEAQTGLEGKPREKLNALLAEVCALGEDMPAARMVEFISATQALMVEHCTAQAQRFVEAA